MQTDNLERLAAEGKLKIDELSAHTPALGEGETIPPPSTVPGPYFELAKIILRQASEIAAKQYQFEGFRLDGPMLDENARLLDATIAKYFPSLGDTSDPAVLLCLSLGMWGWAQYKMYLLVLASRVTPNVNNSTAPPPDDGIPRH